MSLSFNTFNLKASTAVILSKEDIDALLYPVTITLDGTTLITGIDDGPVVESATETTSSTTTETTSSSGGTSGTRTGTRGTRRGETYTYREEDIPDEDVVETPESL